MVSSWDRCALFQFPELPVIRIEALGFRDWEKRSTLESGGFEVDLNLSVRVKVTTLNDTQIRYNSPLQTIIDSFFGFMQLQPM